MLWTEKSVSVKRKEIPMKLTGLFKRGAACLCTAAILMGGISAFA